MSLARDGGRSPARVRNEPPAETADPIVASHRVTFACFDGYRGLAAMAVLVTHVSFLTGFNGDPHLGRYLARLDVGVSVFFLISGFLLYRPFADAFATGDPMPRTGAYLKRRFLRIYPAYWLVLIVTLAVLGAPAYDAGDLLAQFGLVHVWIPQIALGPAHQLAGFTVHPLGQAWSLGTEVAFYAFLPLFAALVAWLGRGASAAGRLRVQVLALAVLYALGWVFRWGVATADVTGETALAMQTWLPNYFDQFALGMGLAVVSVRVVRRPGDRAPLALDRPFAPAVCWLAAAACFVVVANWAGVGPETVVYTVHQQFLRQFLYSLVALFLLLPGVFGPARSGLVRRMLQTKVLVFLGLVSYGVYLWHEVVLELVFEAVDASVFATSFLPMLLAVAALTVAVAAVSYYVLERPALALKYRSLGGARAAGTRGTR